MIKSTSKHGNQEISASWIFRNISKVDLTKIASDFLGKISRNVHYSFLLLSVLEAFLEVSLKNN